MSATGWRQFKKIATSNNVEYRLFQRRVYSGMSPEEAATMRPDQKQTPQDKSDLTHLLGRKIKTEGPMSRAEALEQIDIQTVTYCDPCETRIQMNKRNGNNTSKLERVCINECPVGKQIQALSEYLTVGPRKPVPAVWNK